MRISLTAWTLLLLSLMMALLFIAAPSAQAGFNSDYKKWKACKYEDSHRCVWDARHRGNGHGRSFFVNAHGVHYVAHWRAHEMIERSPIPASVTDVEQFLQDLWG